MKKRILSFLLVLLLTVNMIPTVSHAADNEDPSAATAETEGSCVICGQPDCLSDHPFWCELCRKDDCGQAHEACSFCGTIDCQKEHKNWCDVCKTDDCGKDHIFCTVCEIFDCGKTHVYCENCRKYDCGIDHTASDTCDLCGADPCVCATDRCNICGNEICICKDATVLCENCLRDPCICITIPACSGTPDCWGDANGDPMCSHAQACERKAYLESYVTGNTAQSIAANWARFTYKEQTDILSMVESYTTYAQTLKSMVNWGEDPEEPEQPESQLCNCGSTGAVHTHEMDCMLYIQWKNRYVEEMTVQEISDQWLTLDADTRESILQILAQNAPQKLEELQASLPENNAVKESVVNGAAVQVIGDIPEEVVLKTGALPVGSYNSEIFQYVSGAAEIFCALDVTLYHPDDSLWQPEDGQWVRVAVDALALGLQPDQRVRLIHDHEGMLQDLGVYSVTNGMLTFRMERFSAIYVIPVNGVEQNALDDVVYFDLNAGNVLINGAEYTGFRFDGGDTAKQVTGTLQPGQSYYVYQSNASNKNQTGLFNTGTSDAPVYEMRLPQYARVEKWADFITNNTDIDGDEGVIAGWNKLAGNVGRTSTGNKISITGVQNCQIVIEDLWSNYHKKGNLSSDAGFLFKPSGHGSRLTVIAKGDNRFGKIYYQANKGTNNQIQFNGESDSTLTVANLEQNSDANWWRAAIGADDGNDTQDADGIVINSGYIYAGTNAMDDCTAIGGGGNGYGGVTITGGTVTAVVSSSGAAIGGGIGKSSNGGQATVNITGGTVYAYNFSCVSGGYSNTGVAYIPAAAIGGGSSAKSICSPCTVNISGGNVFARSVGGTAVGGGSSADTHGGDSTIIISGGTVDVASIAGTVGGNPVKAGAAIGGGTGGTNGNGGNCTLTISGNPTIYTGSIGGGKTLNTTGANTIGAATVNISGGTLQGQVIMAKGAATDCSFNMTGGTIDNTASLYGTLNEDGDLCFTRGDGPYNLYTFLEENGGAAYVENGIATLSGGTVKNTKATNGGAFYVTGGTFHLNGGTIQNASATQSGGSICVVNGTANITSGTVSGTSAPNGGAAAVTGGTFQMTGGSMSNFHAQENGGAVYVMGGTAKVGGTITGSADKTEAKKGGAVYVGGGTLEITGGSITQCNADTMGGAICVEKVGSTSGTVTVTKGQIKSVYAPNGGAIAVSGGTFSMAGGEISDVMATSDGQNADGFGGAVYVKDGSATVSDGDIIGDAEAPEAGSGGGVYVEGGSFTMTGGTMNNFNVTKNGGMVCVTGSGAAATIQGGTISGNKAAAVNEAEKGGAVYVSAGGSFTIDGEGVIQDCNATASGGGVYLDDGTFTVNGGIFQGCSAAENGGGVYMGSGTFDMNGGSFKNCTAVQNGGGVYLGGGTFDLGGNGNFTSCEASGNGGGIYLANGSFAMPGGSVVSCTAENGGGVYLDANVSIPDNVDLETLDYNFKMTGGSFEACSAQTDGGSVYISGGSANIQEGKIQGDNQVLSSDDTTTVQKNTQEAVNGGGIYIGGGILNMSNGTITLCSAEKGGAAYISGGQCYMKGGTVSYNCAQDGGAMYVVNTPVTYGGLNDLTVEWNFADRNGGGLYVDNDGQITTVTNGLIQNNRAGAFGGGIYHTGEGGSCTVSGTGQIRENTAQNGGGLYIIGGSTLNVNGGHITQNHAEGMPEKDVETAYYHDKNIGVGGGVYVGPGTTVASSFTMNEGKAAGIYSNLADFAADDVYANVDSTVLSLPNVTNMALGDSLTATGWYCDYAAHDSQWKNDTLLDLSKFDNPNLIDTERYRTAAVNTSTEPYKVDKALKDIEGYYVCLTIGSDIINFGTIVINKTGSLSQDQYFVFRVEATALDNAALEKPVFEVAIQGNGSVTIERVPFGVYTVSEVESWSWRYEVAQEDQAVQSVRIQDTNKTGTVSFANRIDEDVAYDTTTKGSLWLDGNSPGRVNVWNQKQEAQEKSKGSLLDALFNGKEAAG